ncbi:hypothetical protein WJX81_007874 [Elliptochloris bilobata]|uniref:Cytochrome P450 n=1 Tax=Elliptochloris bilobata TaxID=381761 RepID=A0AAW1RG32_9CHLO
MLLSVAPCCWSTRQATEWAEEFGPIYKVRFLFYHAIVITDPLLARYVLRSKLLDKFRFLYSFLDPFLAGPNLLTGNTDEHWRAVRKGVAPAFSAANMRAAFTHVVERSEKLVAILDGHGPRTPINVDNLLLRESMDIIGRVGFEYEMGALESLAAGDDAGPGRNMVWIPASTGLLVVHRVEEPLSVLRVWDAGVRHGRSLLEQWKEVVRKLLGHIQRIDPGDNTFANLLMATRDPKTGKQLSDAQMLPEIAALFFAGIDTTGHTGTWALFLLAQHPEVEARLAAELDAAKLLATPARPRPHQLQWADLGRLTYLQAVIKEVLRMYPPVGLGQIRISHRHDLHLAGGRIRVPRGTALWVPHHGMHNVSFNWDRPHDFLPERWLAPGTELAQQRPMPQEWYAGWDAQLSAGQLSVAADDADGQDAPKRWFPFAEGPRSCVGKSLAQVTLPATLAILLSHFTFRLADEMGGAEGVRARETYSLVTGIKGGMMMHAVPRVDLQD